MVYLQIHALLSVAPHIQEAIEEFFVGLVNNAHRHIIPFFLPTT